MKKLFMIAAMMLISIGMFAQNEVGQITLKPMAGVNLSTMTKYKEADMRVGAVAGVEGEYGLTKKISVTAGLLYSMQGAKIYGFKYNLDYINIPILLNYYVYQGLAIKAGLQPALNVSSNIERKELDYNTNTFYFSFPVGASYEYKNFVIDARYNFGVQTVFSPGDSRHSWFSVSLGYKFPIWP
jgi:hypothetical protein